MRNTGRRHGVRHDMSLRHSYDFSTSAACDNYPSSHDGSGVPECPSTQLLLVRSRITYPFTQLHFC